MTPNWMRDHRRDYYYKKAKQENYRSRAAFKLLQAVKKYGFLKSNDIIVDLGAAPGGWLQISRKIIGINGLAIGVDIKEIEPFNYKNIITIIRDIRKSGTTEKIKSVLPKNADVVMSDVSPNVSGIWEYDHIRQIELAETSFKIALNVLKPKGNFFVKAFQGDTFNRFLKDINKNFYLTRIFKPKASRSKSAEVYILGSNLIIR